MANWAHQGYMDGYQGHKVDDHLTGAEDYDTAYLIGCQDRESGLKLEYSEKVLPIAKGTEVKIPKGTVVKTAQLLAEVPQELKASRKVKVHQYLPPCPAFFTSITELSLRTFRRPEPATVVWAGTGKFWHKANVKDVVIL